jgi:hypothetical protein
VNPDLEVFLQAWTGGADVSDADRQRLLQRLETDAAFRAECAAETWLLGMLRAVQSPPPRWLDINDALGLSAPAASEASAADLSLAVMARVHREDAAAGRFAGPFRRPLAAAAVGIVVGTLCTSAVLGFASRPAGRSTTLVRESFEAAPPPATTGVPAGPGLWSGDYSEVVGGQQGVKPASGTAMLRFLRSDHDGSTGPRPRRSGDIMRVVDVSRLSQSIDRGAVMVTLSAVFDAAGFPVDERYDGMVTIYALDADLDLDDATEDVVQQEALALSSGDVKSLDRDPGTWQPASGTLLLPPGTARVLLKVSLRRMPVGRKGLDSLPEKVSFAGHFVDDVQASLVITEPTAAPRTRAAP